jgi:hypothetical protein
MLNDLCLDGTTQISMYYAYTVAVRKADKPGYPGATWKF